MSRWPKITITSRQFTLSGTQIASTSWLDGTKMSGSTKLVMTTSPLLMSFIIRAKKQVCSLKRMFGLWLSPHLTANILLSASVNLRFRSGTGPPSRNSKWSRDALSQDRIGFAWKQHSLWMDNSSQWDGRTLAECTQQLTKVSTQSTRCQIAWCQSISPLARST